ncbi:protein PLASTID REDOX INSENSITIVE 2, chloroplastic isoform X1 [Lactuca sativa]|uniref:Uncharacterized protein n=1 Tax=Lactuca sativa TaxID=4236 RepID=A0A9R1W358_LACSA|nr:protein PLASTID REDOX INSENSITIVE 2, chloroplastic isoform X1 [Lactuca sativa]KAJ0218932.1 hypothetical protein LSAT_V11C300121030 [Lactuca sativa]
MAVFHTPIVSISSTALTTLLAPTKPKSSNLASLPISGCVIPRSLSKIPSLFLLRATPLQKYVYPDPIPEFAVYETKKFREELKKKLYKERDTFGDDLDKVVDTCTELFSEFVHKEYGGPGTLVVEPFTDMLIGLKQRKLPGANLAARASLLWAQNYLDHDWEIWNSKLQ